jgi:RNA polymerase sigma factor (TIGR02999 family)
VTSGARAKGSGDAASPPITTLLAAARGGDRAASDDVFALVYQELRRLAARRSRRSAASTLSTTALVHEVYLKLGGDGSVVVANDRAHFFALAARAMRQILVDHARHGDRKKRGGDVRVVSLDALAEHPPDAAAVGGREDLLALDRALRRLAALDPDLEQLVEWRFFAGLTLAEISALTGTPERTLKRSWSVARLFLLREINGGEETPATP